MSRGQGQVDGREALIAEVESLRAQGQRLWAAFQESPAAMVLVDDRQHCVDANPAARTLLGLTDTEVVGRPLADLTPRIGGLTEALHRLQDRRDGGGPGRPVEADGTRRVAEWVTIANLPPGRELLVLIEAGAESHPRDDTGPEARRLEALHEIDKAILAATSPAEIAQSALARTEQIIPSGCIMLFLREEGESVVFASLGPDAGCYPPGTRFPLSTFDPAELAALEGGEAVVAEVLAAPSLGDRSGQPAGPDRARFYLRVPLSCEGHLIGSLNLYEPKARGFSPEQVQTAREVADSLAVALQHARLFEEVRAGRERLQILSRRLIRAQEDERRHIARELHDEVGQALTALKVYLQRARKGPVGPSAEHCLDECVGLIDRTLGQVRALSLGLRPSMLDDLGLVAALRSLVNGLAQRTGLDARIEVQSGLGRANPDVETACYRVAQEALTNVVRHASAGRVVVELGARGTDLRLVVTDDGTGFDVGDAADRAARGSSLGVLGMRERAELVGGGIEIDSRPGRGTIVSAHFPVVGPGAEAIR